MLYTIRCHEPFGDADAAVGGVSAILCNLYNFYDDLYDLYDV